MLSRQCESYQYNAKAIKIMGQLIKWKDANTSGRFYYEINTGRETTKTCFLLRMHMIKFMLLSYLNITENIPLVHTKKLN